MRRMLFWLFLLALFLSACNPTATPISDPTPLPTAIVPEKPTYTVARGEVVDSLAFTGCVSLVEEAELYFRADGRVLQVHADGGDVVEAGSFTAIPSP